MTLRQQEMESDDRMSWDIAKQLTGDRGAMMRNTRAQYLVLDPPLRKVELINVLLITNTVAEAPGTAGVTDVPRSRQIAHRCGSPALRLHRHRAR